MTEIMNGQDKKNYDDIESPVRDINDIPEEEKAKNFAFDDSAAQDEIRAEETVTADAPTISKEIASWTYPTTTR